MPKCRGTNTRDRVAGSGDACVWWTACGCEPIRIHCFDVGLQLKQSSDALGFVVNHGNVQRRPTAAIFGIDAWVRRRGLTFGGLLAHESLPQSLVKTAVVRRRQQTTLKTVAVDMPAQCSGMVSNLGISCCRLLVHSELRDHGLCRFLGLLNDGQGPPGVV